MAERNLIALKLVLAHIIIPAGLTFAFYLILNVDYLLFAITQTYLCILFLTGYWEFFSSLFKKLFFLLVELILFIILINKFITSSNANPNVLLVLILLSIQVCLTFLLFKIIIVIFKKEKKSLEIAFPLRDGRYLITDGGNSKISRLMNYHFYSPIHRKNKTNKSMQFAVDIVKLGSNRKKFLPKQNEAYPVFSEKVYCPIKGQIIKVENNIDDNVPFIRCKDGQTIWFSKKHCKP